MPSLQHSEMLSAQVHEPKHITSSDTSDSGKVVTPSSSVAGTSVLRRLGLQDLEDSGDLRTYSELLEEDAINYQGWQMVEDGTGSPFSVSSTSSVLSIDDDGATNNTNDSYLPKIIRGSGTLWDAPFRFSPIAVGDSYILRLNLKIDSTSGNPSRMSLDLDIGTGSSPSNVVYSSVHEITKTPPYNISFTIPVFTLATFVGNGGRIFLKTDTGTASVTDRSVMVTRTGTGNNG